VIVVVFNVCQVVSAECGVLSAVKPGKSFVNLSSVEVETSIDLYEVGSDFLISSIVGLQTFLCFAFFSGIVS